jgi:hypothetical protein
MPTIPRIQLSGATRGESPPGYRDRGADARAHERLPEHDQQQTRRSYEVRTGRIVNPTPRRAGRSTVARLDLPGPTGSGEGQGSPRGHGCPGWGYWASVSERGSRTWRAPARAYPASCAAGGGRWGLPSDVPGGVVGSPGAGRLVNGRLPENSTATPTVRVGEEVALLTPL